MRQAVPILCLLATIARAQPPAQPGIRSPQLGWVRDADNALRPVTGLAGNFILGDSVLEGVVSSAFSGSFGIVKTATALAVLDREGQILFHTETEPGPALFAFSDQGLPAFVYLTQSQTLLKWNTDRLEPAPWDVDLTGGDVQAIASPGPDRAAVIVKRDGGLWLIDLSLLTQTLLPGVEGPVLLRNNGALLYAPPQGLVLRQTGQSEQALEGSVAAATFTLMGKEWVHVTERGSSRHFAVRLESGREQIYQLPEAQP